MSTDLRVVIKGFFDKVVPHRYATFKPRFKTSKGIPAYSIGLERYDAKLTVMLVSVTSLVWRECVLLEHAGYTVVAEREWPDWSQTGSKRLDGTTSYYVSGDIDLFRQHATFEHLCVSTSP